MNSLSRGERAGHRSNYGTKADDPIKRNFVSTILITTRVFHVELSNFTKNSRL